jgi:hypothetical protein
MRQIYQGDPNLPSNFQMNPEKVPIGDFPINRKLPIADFSQVCYNAAAEFVNGFDPDCVRNSDAGKYCKQTVNNLILDIGKNPCQVNIPVPVINLQPKFFQTALRQHKNPEKALNHCLIHAENFNAKGGDYNPDWCHAAYTIYKKVYEKPEQTEYFEEPVESVVEAPAPTPVPAPSPSPSSNEGANCWVVGIVSGLIVISFIVLLVMVIQNLTTVKIKN